MARPLRIQYPGAFYHITARGNERRAIFSSDRDRKKLLSLFSEAALRYRLSIHTYCLMENHYHLLLETAGANLSQAMHFINGGYTSYYNRTHHRSGHLFQGRYRAILVDKDSYAMILSRYIHLNPVRAGLSSRPQDYRWSSYSAYLHPKERPSWLETSFILGYFGSKEEEARRGYRPFVEEGMGEKASDPLAGTISGILLGGEEFIEWARENVIQGIKKDRDLPALRQLRSGPSLERVKEIVQTSLGKNHRWTRDVSLLLCRRYAGGSLREIGALHGRMEESAVSQAIGRLVRRMEQDKQLKREVTRMEIEVRRLSTV